VDASAVERKIGELMKWGTDESSNRGIDELFNCSEFDVRSYRGLISVSRKGYVATFFGELMNRGTDEMGN
jgi:hypothetical protein